MLELQQTFDVYLDLGNIAGFVALKHTVEFIQSRDLSARWLPIKGIVPRPLSREPNGIPNDELAEFKYKRWQAKRKLEQDELERDCARLALNVERAKGQFDASFSHIGWLNLLRAGLDPVPFLTQVYQARFEKGEALEDERSILRLLKQSGLAECSFESAIWERHETEYLAVGIHDSPSYVVEGEIFQGRQHFPLMAWRLDGQTGSPPV